MEPNNRLQTIASFSALKLLGDPLRRRVLRLLMAEPATLSRLGQILALHPARVRHHLKQLESAGLVSLTSTRVVRGFVEKYYQATAQAYRVSQVILPETENRSPLLITGSDDLALEMLAASLADDRDLAGLQVIPLGSLEGLIALRQGIGQLAGCHLLYPPTGEYNLSYVRHLFPSLDVRVITLARREQGLILAAGNPHRIRGLADLAERSLRFVNRNPGSGTRVLLDHQLRMANIARAALRGYEREVRTHREVARAVAGREADAGLGLRAAAKSEQLEFLPLFEERFDLVIPGEQYHSDRLSRVLERIHSGPFRRAAESLGGYHTGETGTEQPLT